MLWEKKEEDELDQECWNVISTRKYIFFNLYFQNAENFLALSRHAHSYFEVHKL